jgi:branched-subunit amino acid aminotransferase/4-amino-4-deoxychorismate lyase
VTVDVVRQMASEAGVDVRYEEFAPADVDGQDLWALNALHGIRGVSVWNDGPTLSSDTDRLREWQTHYWSRATNVSEGR